MQALESFANALFDAYRELYYEGGLSSVYLWEASPSEAPLSPDTPFAACFLVHKGRGSGRHGGSLTSGRWDSVHVAEVLPGPEGETAYKLSSSVSLALATQLGAEAGGRFQLAGSLSRSWSGAHPTPGRAEGHLLALGRAVEEMEGKLRGALDSVYFGTTRGVVAGLRAEEGGVAADRQRSLQAGLVAEMVASSTLGRQSAAKAAGVPGVLEEERLERFGGGKVVPGRGMAMFPGSFDPKAALAQLRKTKAGAKQPGAAEET